jgi:hypothetical protein
MHQVLLTALLSLPIGPTMQPMPDPPPVIKSEWQPCMRTEAFEVTSEGYERYLRKKRNKAKRETWRQ